tara:strand:- start:223 stop:1923 length:1701 start_codon:yes stop_codon:yes gene_type:complete
MKSLILTSLNTNLSNKNQIYLGLWCLFKEDFRTIDKNFHRISKYHWSNKQKFYSDTVTIENIYKKYLKKISYKLNEFHEIDRDTRYWEIILGYWLRNFISIFFDRWFQIKFAKDNFNFESCIVNKINKMPPQNSKEFFLQSTSDDWNEWIYSQILQCFDTEIIYSEKISLDETKKNKLRKVNFIKKEKEIIKKQNILLSTNLGLYNEVFIDQNFIKFFFKFNDYVFEGQKVDFEIRKKIFSFPISETIFEKSLNEILINSFPVTYLENFKNYNNYLKYKIPYQFVNILTSNLHISNDMFSIWVANNVYQNNSKLYIFQNGGNEGLNNINFTKNHNLDISNLYFDWGWQKKDNNSFIGSSKLYRLSKKFKKKYNWLNKEFLLVTTETAPFHSIHIDGAIGSSIFYDFKYLFELIHNIEISKQKNFKIRLNHKSYGWNIKREIKEKFPSIQFDKIKSYYSAIFKYRCIIFFYYGTTFIESMYFNIPSIIFLSNNWINCIDDKVLVKSMQDCKILHTNINDLIHHINSIEFKLKDWWLSNDVQESRKLFLNKYGNCEINMINKLKKILK